MGRPAAPSDVLNPEAILFILTGAVVPVPKSIVTDPERVNVVPVSLAVITFPAAGVMPLSLKDILGVMSL